MIFKTNIFHVLLKDKIKTQENKKKRKIEITHIGMGKVDPPNLHKQKH